MGTRIEVNVEGSGLAGRNRQQIAANRQAQAERELRARAEARARVQREEFLASQGLNPDGSPNAEYQNLRRGRFVGDDPAANRSGYTGVGINYSRATLSDPIDIGDGVFKILAKRAGYVYAPLARLAPPLYEEGFEVLALGDNNINESVVTLENGTYGQRSIKSVAVPDDDPLNNTERVFMAAIVTLPKKPEFKQLTSATSFTAEFDFRFLDLRYPNEGPLYRFTVITDNALAEVIHLFDPEEGVNSLRLSLFSNNFQSSTSVTIESPLPDDGSWRRLSLTKQGQYLYMHVNGALSAYLQADFPFVFSNLYSTIVGMGFGDVKEASMGSMRMVRGALYGADSYIVRPIP